MISVPGATLQYQGVSPVRRIGDPAQAGPWFVEARSRVGESPREDVLAYGKKYENIAYAGAIHLK